VLNFFWLRAFFLPLMFPPSHRTFPYLRGPVIFTPPPTPCVMSFFPPPYSWSNWLFVDPVVQLVPPLMTLFRPFFFMRQQLRIPVSTSRQSFLSTFRASFPFYPQVDPGVPLPPPLSPRGRSPSFLTSGPSPLAGSFPLFWNLLFFFSLSSHFF